MELIDSIEKYQCENEQEEKDKKLILDCLKNQDKVFTRDNKLCHMTVSAWIVNNDFSKVLMAYHNIFQSFSWLGGHADGNEDLKEVIVKEIKEESGLNTFEFVDENIFSLEILTVNGHFKKGEYVPSHLHLNVSYLVKANDKEMIRIKEDENSDIKWFDFDKAVDSSNEKWLKENIYQKLNNKVDRLYRKK